eukprot:6297468-Prymnesium_polylepis.1
MAEAPESPMALLSSRRSLRPESVCASERAPARAVAPALPMALPVSLSRCSRPQRGSTTASRHSSSSVQPHLPY